MKKIVVLFVIAFAWAGMHAQGFGVEAGLNMGSLKWDEGDGVLNYSGKMGLNLGVFYEYEVGDNMYLHGGIAYSQYGGKYNKGRTTSYFNLNYIDLPFMFKYGFDVSDFRAYITAGPVVSMALSGKFYREWDGEEEAGSGDILFTNSLDRDHFDKFQMKKTNMSFRIGGGISFDKIDVGLYYSAGLSNLALFEDESIKTGLMSLLIGYRFM